MFRCLGSLISLRRGFEPTSFLHPNLEPPSSHRLSLEPPNALRSSLELPSYLRPSLQSPTSIHPSQSRLAPSISAWNRQALSIPWILEPSNSSVSAWNRRPSIPVWGGQTPSA